MSTYKVKAELNGYMVFDVKASSKEEAQKMVDDLLSDTSVSQALERYADTLKHNVEIKENNKDLER